MPAGQAQFEAGSCERGGRRGAPRLLAATDPQGDYAFLSLHAPAFDLTDRGVGGRPAPNGLDAFVYAERGVYRSGETAYITALLRDAQGAAALGVPLTLVVERPDGVEFRRTRGRRPGRRRPRACAGAAGVRPDRHLACRAYTDPKRPAVGETTFLVEDYVPDRIEFDLTSSAPSISRRTCPPRSHVAGRFLYGAPASNLDLDGDMTISAAKRAHRLCRLSVRPGRRARSRPSKQPLDDLPATDAAGKATFPVSLDKLPATTHPLQAQITVRMAEPGGRAVEHKLTLPVTPAGNMIGVKPLFSGRSLADGASASFDVVVVAPDGKALAAARPALSAAAHRHALSVLQARRPVELRAGQDHDARRRRHARHRGRQARPHRAAGEFRPLSARSVARRSERSGDVGRFRCRLVCRRQRRHARHAAGRARQAGISPRRHDDGRRHGAQRRPAHAQRHRRPAAGDPDAPMSRTAVAQIKVPVGRDWGTGAYLVATLAPAARRAGAAHAGPRHRRAMVLDRQARPRR